MLAEIATFAEDNPPRESFDIHLAFTRGLASFRKSVRSGALRKAVAQECGVHTAPLVLLRHEPLNHASRSQHRPASGASRAGAA